MWLHSLGGIFAQVVHTRRAMNEVLSILLISRDAL